MSANELREAAKVLREKAENVRRAPWDVLHIDASRIPTEDGADQWLVMGCFDGDRRNPSGPLAVCDWEPSADYIATMHPGVGIALADWLDGHANQCQFWSAGANPQSLAVARLILGGAS